MVFFGSDDDPMGSREKLKKAWYRRKMAEQERSRRDREATLHLE